MNRPIRTHALPDGREVRTRRHEHKGDRVELHTSLLEGEWLWSYSVSVGTSYGGALPFPGRAHEPPAPTEGEALQRAARAALDRLEWSKGPAALREWLQGVMEPQQAALFEVAL